MRRAASVVYLNGTCLRPHRTEAGNSCPPDDGLRRAILFPTAGRCPKGSNSSHNRFTLFVMTGFTPDIQEVLQRGVPHFARPRGTDMLARTQPFFEWQDNRRRSGLWPYARSLDSAPAPEAHIRSDDGRRFAGVNFASQDYLGLTAHPAVREAGIAAIREHGPHSSGAPVLLGNTAPSLRLEERIAETLHMTETVLFPTGWAAGFGTITGLVRPYDHVVMDELAHQCLQQGAYTATRNVHRFDHLSYDALEKRLHSIRDEDAKAGILVVTESLFSMNADVPDIRAVQDLCNTYDATLLLDVAHDFGAMGPGGTGVLGMQDMLGKVDLVMGSFSKTFASNGGFVAVHSPSVKQYLKYYSGTHAFSNALSPAQCATVDSALSIVRSDEGEQLRDHLERVILTIRTQFESHGISCLGIPSPIVPVQVEDKSVAWLASKKIAENGVLANLVEYPAVAAGSARFRLQVMATHSMEQACAAADIIADALEAAQKHIAPDDRLAEHAP